MGRPATPMTPPDAECEGGALSLEDGAAFLGIGLGTLKEIVYTRRELDLVYEGRKPRVLRRQLVARLASQLEEARARAERPGRSHAARLKGG